MMLFVLCLRTSDHSCLAKTQVMQGSEGSLAAGDKVNGVRDAGDHEDMGLHVVNASL